MAALKLTQAADTQPAIEETTYTTSEIKTLKPQQDHASKPGTVCQHCQTPISDKAKFCGSCGKPVAIELVKTPEPPPALECVCLHCNQPLGEKARFCGSCGKPVD